MHVYGPPDVVQDDKAPCSEMRPNALPLIEQSRPFMMPVKEHHIPPLFVTKYSGQGAIKRTDHDLPFPRIYSTLRPLGHFRTSLQPHIL